jgi:DNA ligase-1
MVNCGQRGKYTGILGAIRCQLESGVKFKIGTGFSDEDRKNPPMISAEATFKYQEFTKYGKPRFPVFLRVREK